MTDDSKKGGAREGAGRKKTLSDSQVRKARSIDDDEYQLVLKLRQNEDLKYAVRSMVDTEN